MASNQLRSAVVSSPGLIQRIALRFKGIPLEGEAHAPRALLSDCGLKYHCETPIPAIPKDLKEHPDRDIVNFPHPVRTQYGMKWRMMIVPDSWCRAVEKVTGTSGPYLLTGGVATFLWQKEIFVYDEQTWLLYGIIMGYLFISRAFGYRTDKYITEVLQKRINFMKSLKEEDLKEATEFRKESVAQSQSLKAVAEQFPTIFRENMALQLEAVYRRNMDAATNELKRRLDYLNEVEETKERFERDIFIRSIKDGVQRQITNNEGGIRDNFLENCISQLRGLSPDIAKA